MGSIWHKMSEPPRHSNRVLVCDAFGDMWQMYFSEGHWIMAGTGYLDVEDKPHRYRWAEQPELPAESEWA